MGLLGELNDIEVLWLRFFAYQTMDGDDEFRELHEDDTPVYAELAVRYESVEALEQMIDAADLEREHVPWTAAFLAGKAFEEYRRAGGARRCPLPDFCIGAQAAVTDMALLTRDAAPCRTYFPTVHLIAPHTD